MKSHKVLDQSYYQSMELCGITGINPTITNNIKKKLKIKNYTFEREGVKRQGVSKDDVIKIMLEKGYTRITTKDGRDLLVRKVVEIK